MHNITEEDIEIALEGTADHPEFNSYRVAVMDGKLPVLKEVLRSHWQLHCAKSAECDQNMLRTISNIQEAIDLGVVSELPEFPYMILHQALGKALAME